MATPEQILAIARREIGYCRFDDPKTGTKYGRWYADLTGNNYYSANGVPYCAMFQSFIFYEGGQGAPGLPGAYCPWIVDAGRRAGNFHPAREGRPGDLVLFDWEGDGVSDHIGIVEYNNGSYLTCIEGNTTGPDGRSGSVARRTRAYSTVVGVIHPEWFDPTPYVPVNVATSDQKDDPAQLWYIRGEIKDGGEVAFRNIANWLWLSDPNSSTESGTPAQTWGGDAENLNPRDPQKMILKSSVGGSWQIQPKVAPYLRLDVKNGSFDSGTSLQFYTENETAAQDFFIYPYEGKYRIISAASGKPLAVY